MVCLFSNYFLYNDAKQLHPSFACEGNDRNQTDVVLISWIYGLQYVLAYLARYKSKISYRKKGTPKNAIFKQEQAVFSFEVWQQSRLHWLDADHGPVNSRANALQSYTNDR